MTEVLALAVRGVSRNRRRTLITGTMIALGVCSVIFARGYIAGLQVMMTDTLIDVRYGSLQVSQRGYHASAELAPLDVDLPAEGDIHDALAHMKHVEAVSGRISFLGMISKGEASQVFAGLGLDPRTEPKVCPIGPATTYHTTAGNGGDAYQLIAGDGLREPDGVVLGVELARALEAKVGDAITLLVQTRTGSVDAVDARVSGIYVHDQPEDNRRSVIVPLGLAQRVTHMPGRVTAFAVRVSERSKIDGVSRAIEQKLSASEPPIEVLSWAALGPYLADVMKLQDRVLGVVMVVIFALLLTGVANTMLMSVFERTREVGTLMCLGMRRRRIVVLFVLEAVLLSVLAAGVGTAIGLAAIRIAHAIGLPFFIPAVGKIVVRPTIDAPYVLFTIGAAWVSALLAALYPAWRASRMNPVDALRAT